MRVAVRIGIACAAVMAAAGTAQAGLRAVYIDVAKARQLQIDVGDNGDARITEIGSEDYGLLIGGDFYIVDVEGGRPTVARLRDVATAIDQVLPPIFKGLLDRGGAGPGSTRLTITPDGTGSAGGHDGRVYHVRGLDSTAPDKVVDYVISDDPALKPVGAALEQFMNAALVPAAPLIGGMAVELIAETRSIFALGTPIEIGGRFRLNLAGKAAFHPGNFQLPARPQTVPQLVAAMQVSMGAKQ